MNNLTKEEQHKTDTYLMQSNKSKKEEVTGIFIIHPRLLLETTMMKKSLTETVLLSFTNLEPNCESIFKSCWQGFNWYQCRLFTRKFQALLYLKYVKLTDCLYNVAFGDLNFTDLGKMFTWKCRKDSKLYTKEKHHTNLLGTSFHF
jgi:hypothetical protein